MECRDSNLLDEDLAIVLNEEFAKYKELNILIASFFDSKIECSVINKLSFRFQRSFRFDGSMIINEFSFFRSVLSAIYDEFPLGKALLFSLRIDDLYKKLIEDLSSFSVLENREDLILKGLKKLPGLSGYLVKNRFKV